MGLYQKLISATTLSYPISQLNKLKFHIIDFGVGRLFMMFQGCVLFCFRAFPEVFLKVKKYPSLATDTSGSVYQSLALIENPTKKEAHLIIVIINRLIIFRCV